MISGPGQIDRRVPMVMTFCLLTEIAFALAHHLLYSHMNNRVVRDSQQQQWVTRASTASAFVVKLSLTTASSMAYAQWM
ncbi:hypothetical protein K432DRAFT_459476 [Lepidopterella palustris CBS 459.81]|uniref:Uncharacterized protein n=1 Tax=Lepidopterella palustris CBS 459.81 TaxID=1314670 RepID=A0A8E2JCX3_9PEZI|nr:hypothetical protein K432DRAFT_459476 [Lepidopterella palustris CBS 459.81]